MILAVLAACAAPADHFRERVAPLLSARCVACHGGAKKRGGLDLTTAKGLRAGGENGPVILAPADAEKSRLVQLVSGPSPRMPRVGAKLSAGQVEALRAWIAAGAPWPEGVTLAATKAVVEEVWWSLRLLTRPEVPEVAGERHGVDPPVASRNPIDRFILARLEKEKLTFAPEADRLTLLRRVTFDLTGLPPTPEEQDAFVKDDRPDAYERLVDRLLASPAYGERWARHWLDVARYADTHGYDKDKRRDDAWPYRDWVIAALNAGLPYRDFARMQLAGDVIKPGPEGVIAAGFIAAGPWDFVGHVELREGTVDKLKTRVIDRDDMVSAALGTFMSVTVGCARCHDHKFDPITQRDYYRLQAVFAGVERGPRRLDLPEMNVKQRELAAERARIEAALAAVEKKIAALSGPDVAAASARLEKARAELAALKPPAAAASRTNGYHSAIVAKPDTVKWVQIDLGAVVPLDEVRLFPARPVDFPDTPGFGFPARFRIETSDEAGLKAPRVLADHTAADFANPGDVPYVLPLKGQKGRFVRVTATRLWKRTGDYIFALSEMQVIAAGKLVSQGRPVSALDSIEAGLWAGRHLVDGSTSRHVLPEGVKAFTRRMELLAALRADLAARDAAIEKLVPPALRAERDRLTAALAAVDARRKALSAGGPSVYSVVPIPPRPIHLLKRGDVEQTKEAMTPGGLACLTALKADFPASAAEGQRRLALADWVAHRENPLTYRSIANRLWHWHFGRGIVDTPSDFGKMGGRPSHPELLDWLACELRDGGSLKPIHGLIVTSAAYRQAGRHDEAAARIDADNRLLWRAPRRRLDAEALRDAVLAVAGQLRTEMGGKGYDLFRFKDDHSPVYDHDDIARMTDPKTYRRTIYRFAVRSVPNPFLDTLDCPDPNQPVPVRNTTLTALQALSLMNNPFMVRQAGHLASRLRAYSDDPPRQVEYAYRLLYGRRPAEDEADAVAAHARRHGLKAACRVLLNGNEFVFVD